MRSSRQQTLRATLDWSYELLTETERELFRQLSVFVGGFTLDALESVALLDSNQSILDALSRLVDKSLLLVEQQDQPRYRFLEPIRQYARDKLNETRELNLIQDRHLNHYLRRRGGGRAVLIWRRATGLEELIGVGP